MADDDNRDDLAFIRGKSQPVVREFVIEGLYGHRRLSLQSRYAASILIAKNGSGKTTLLGSLNHVLKLQFHRLRLIDFELIYIQFEGDARTYSVTKSDIDQISSQSRHRSIVQYATAVQLVPEVLYNYLMEEFTDDMSFGQYYNHPVLKKIVPAERSDYEAIATKLRKLKEDILFASPNVRAMVGAIRDRLRGMEVVYLPTYRRIETSLAQEASDDYDFSPQQPKTNLMTSGRYRLDIQFGLSDIVYRLQQLNREVTGKSSQAYGRVSLKIINDLLDGTFDDIRSDEIVVPEVEDMELFLHRAAQANFGPYRSVVPPKLEDFYRNVDKSGGSSKFLYYFLSQVGNVLAETRQIENDIGSFIDGCNNYLSMNDRLVLDQNGRLKSPPFNIDGKKMSLNRLDLTVEVRGLGSETAISLETLSSGEKQIISILAKMYLYPKAKIVLIDEPEISLSMDWQRHVLTDILCAPKCKQLIAITHSPFVFDNSLEPFAKSLKAESRLKH